MCPSNITRTTGGDETNVSWPDPEFSDSLGIPLNITSTFGKNTVSLGWGEHRVEYTARNTFNNLVTSCVFYVDVTRKSELTPCSTQQLLLVDSLWIEFELIRQQGQVDLKSTSGPVIRFFQLYSSSSVL